MFGSEILDTAIGLVFVFLLVSVLVTIVNEMIAAMLLSRAKWLQFGIARLIGSTWADKLYDHPLIAGSFATAKKEPVTEERAWRGSGPSYLPSRAFADVLIHLVVEADARLNDTANAILAVTMTVDDPKDVATLCSSIETSVNAVSDPAARAVANDLLRGLRAKMSSTTFTVADAVIDIVAFVDAMPLRYLGVAIERLSDGDRIKKTLKLLYREARGDVEKLKESIEIWFNNAMDRVSGWYKRRAQWVAFATGVVAAIGLNVDSINIGNYLQTHAGVRDAVVAQAKTYGSIPPSVDPDDPAGKQFDQAQKAFADTRHQLDQLALPIGWNGNDPATSGAVDRLIISHWIGWLITALAATLGAPFWFDVLNRIISIRSSGKAPEEKPRPPKEQPAPLGPGEAPKEAALLAAVKESG